MEEPERTLNYRFFDKTYQFFENFATGSYFIFN